MGRWLKGVNQVQVGPSDDGRVSDRAGMQRRKYWSTKGVAISWEVLIPLVHILRVPSFNTLGVL